MFLGKSAFYLAKVLGNEQVGVLVGAVAVVVVVVVVVGRGWFPAHCSWKMVNGQLGR